MPRHLFHVPSATAVPCPCPCRASGACAYVLIALLAQFPCMLRLNREIIQNADFLPASVANTIVREDEIYAQYLALRVEGHRLARLASQSAHMFFKQKN